MIGRINSHGFIPKQRVFASTRDTASSSTTAVPPENTLYKRQNAPLRYAESDVYFANERMPNLKLPDSDLLKALHCYTSDFYEQAVDDGTSDFKSFDETALLALGILMEEGVKEIIGRTGDQVFTEGEVVVSPLRKNPGNAPDEDGRQSKKRKIKE